MFDRLVGLPYLDHGRGLAGVDCWGLVWLAHDLRGSALPSYHDRYVMPADKAELAALISHEKETWLEVDAGSEGELDCVLMREGREPRHIGLVTRPGMVLHVERGRTSVIEPYRTGALRHRVLGFYRYLGT